MGGPGVRYPNEMCAEHMIVLCEYENNCNS